MRKPVWGLLVHVCLRWFCGVYGDLMKFLLCSWRCIVFLASTVIISCFPCFLVMPLWLNVLYLFLVCLSKPKPLNAFETIAVLLSPDSSTLFQGTLNPNCTISANGTCKAWRPFGKSKLCVMWMKNQAYLWCGGTGFDVFVVAVCLSWHGSCYLTCWFSIVRNICGKFRSCQRQIFNNQW